MVLPPVTEEQARATLVTERAQALRQLASLDADLDSMMAATEDSNADDEHDPEGQTIAFERAQVAALRGAASRRIEELDQALQRMDQGSYGRCERCAGPIGDERLRARPAARTCIGCAAGHSG